MTNHDVVYQDQSVKDLCLNVLLGNVDTSQFCVLETSTIVTDKFQVTAGIIGASHFIVAKYGDQHISEVFACIEVASSLPRVFFQMMRRIKRTIRLQINRDLNYVFKSAIADLNNPSVETTLEAIKNCANMQKVRDCGIGLYYRFPALNTNDFCPETIVLVQLGEKRKNVITETVHVYPNDRDVVFTHSEIRF